MKRKFNKVNGADVADLYTHRGKTRHLSFNIMGLVI